MDADLDVMIQELQDRLFDAGVAAASRNEIEVDLSTDKITWRGLDTVHFDPDVYDGLAGVRDNCKPHSKNSWKIVDVEVEHQNPGQIGDFFIDHKMNDIGSVKTRIYQLPSSLENSVETFYFMMKTHSPSITLDTDEVHVRSVYVAKLGLLAIGYENEGDPRADPAMNRFLSIASQSNRRNDGLKRRYIGFDTGIRHKPTNRM